MIEEEKSIIALATENGVEPGEIANGINILKFARAYADQEKKKEAIAFHIWVREGGYIRRKGLYYSRHVKGVTLTDEGLYNLYLQYVNQSR